MGKSQMAKLTINVVADLKPAIDVQRYARNNRPVLLRTAANRYIRYLKDRYMRNSAGGGDWKELKPSTLKRKKTRGITKNPAAILIEYGSLISHIRSRINNGRIYVGYGRDTVHPSSGEKSEKGPGRGERTIIRLVRLHQGGGRNVVRRIIVLPDETTRKQMVQDVRLETRREIRRRK